MGRFADPYGEDNRLPEGMVRIGYDADTAQYYYGDRDGTVYEGAPGADYGLLLPVRRYHTGRENNARYRWRTSTTDPPPYNPPVRRSMTNTPQDPRPRPIKRSQTTPPKSFPQHLRGRPTTQETTSPTPPPMPTRSRTLSGRSKDIRVPSPIPEMPTPPVTTIGHKASVISQASVYSQASAPSHPPPTSEFYPNTVQTSQPVAMSTPTHEVTPVVEAESVSQVDPGPQWPPKGWRIYILALSIDPSSRPNLMEYLFDQDTLTFFHPSTLRTSHLPEPPSSSLPTSKREGAAALIAECRRDSIADEPASPQSWLPPKEDVPVRSVAAFPSSPKGTASSSVINIPPIPRAPETTPPPRPRTPSRLKKKRKPGQGNSNRSSQSS